LPPDALITLDFQDVDLRVFIKFIGEITGKNFLVSEQVRGKVTIVSPKKITVEEAYKIFESILEMNGFTAVHGPDATKIIPSGAARQAAIEIHYGKEAAAVKPDDRMITQVIPLEHASAEEIRALFTPFVSKDGALAAYKPTNFLLITERASNVRRMLRIIEQVDVPIVEEKNIGFSTRTCLGQIPGGKNRTARYRRREGAASSAPQARDPAGPGFPDRPGDSR
jgi:general secretion pathway protein D